jgi:hypothetical protein
LKQKLGELNDIVREEGDCDLLDDDIEEGASALSMLATEANAFLVRELEMEIREGMERGRPSSNQAEPSHCNTTANKNVEEGLPRSSAHATLPPMGDDNYFSPLRTHGNHEDIGV